MPTYEYACEACGHTFDIEQRITEDKLTTCPKCGAEALKRLITQGNFILKGSGWYSDLYSGPSNAGKKSAPPKPSAESSKSDSKPAPAKAEPAKPAAKSSGD